jgi:DNA-binding NtrC family response regulator
MRRDKILVVDDEKLIRWSLLQKLSQWNYDTVEAQNGADALKIFDSESPDSVLLDINLPDIAGTEVLREIKSRRPETPVIMITAYGSIEDAVSAMRMGAYDFITKPIDDLKIQSTIKNALETATLKQKVAFYKEKERKQFGPANIIAESESMKKILEMTEIIAQSETTIVLLQGESGTGKDLLAQSIHQMSRRQANPYLAINCSAIPENLLESELFGYEKGAFTDAKQQKKGLVELANEGTLFLDEISTLSLPLQAKLLRFLETMTFRRVGGLKDIEVDLRVIAATNQDLDLAAKEDKFRRDLFYRLNVCPVYIPPLRERREDVLPLADYFIQNDNIKFRKSIQGLDKDAEQLFLVYEWPGNVRELKNAIERAMIFEQGPLVSTKHLPIHLNGTSDPGMPSFSTKTLDNSFSLEAAEKDLLLKALHKSKGNKSQAAKILGISRDTLRYRIKKWNIKPENVDPLE